MSILRQLADIVGERYVLAREEEIAPHARDWRGRYAGSALAVVYPRTTAEVAAVVRLCVEHAVPIVPQAGNTGLVGGAVPLGDRVAIILNVSRMNTIREVDAANNSITVDAGCILATVRQAAEDHDRLFPMLLGSVGSCEVGGLISTNAGGTGVLRYGNMRELVLGLEVVLPDGRIWNGLRALRKDNAGYDLKQLFIGAEGTLGIVTAAVLKLHPRPTQTATAMLALRSMGDVIACLGMMQGVLGNRIEAFELISKSQIEIVLRHGHDMRSPLPLETAWYVMVEIADNALGWNPAIQLEQALVLAMERDLVTNAVIAADLAKARKIWDIRHHISEANKLAGFTVSNDTSVPISRLPVFIERVDTRLRTALPDSTINYVGHVGDGNIHVVVVLAREVYHDAAACESGAQIANTIVHEESVALDGSISAEHGVGLMHRERLERFKPILDIEMMRALKFAFDPDNIMNPGKIFLYKYDQQ